MEEVIDAVLQYNVDITKWGGDRRKGYWPPVSSLLSVDITREGSIASLITIGCLSR